MSRSVASAIEIYINWLLLECYMTGFNSLGVDVFSTVRMNEKGILTVCEQKKLFANYSFVITHSSLFVIENFSLVYFARLATTRYRGRRAL